MKKIAFITGASRGIGRAIAITLAKSGYDLYILCRNSAEQLYELKSFLEETYSISCTCFVGDVSDFQFVESCFQSIKRLDVLVNNAGLSYVGLLSEMDPDSWHQIINTNLSASFYTSKFAIPLMLSQKSGNIINISSVWGNVGASMEVAYSASKGGLNSFTKALAKELAPSNIQVNAVACGIIDTEMNSCFSIEDMAAIKEEIPADRIGLPEEIAQVTLHLINSPSYLTGQILTVDGGWQ